jgi:hypothetical protein
MFRRVLLFAILPLGLFLSSFSAQPLVRAEPAPAANTGYVDFSFFYNASGKSTPNQVLSPTGEKPQSKLWYHDGRWWADMFSSAARAHHIFVLNRQTQKWVDTGTALDNRPQTKSDCLWDGAHLYVVSGGGLVATGADLDARLYRYSYASGAYRLDAGFPVTIRKGGSEAIVIAKDTAARLWVTYTQNNQVYVNRSLASDAAWGTPFVVPASGANPAVAADDISAIVAYGGRIGVLWSNQLDGGLYFASHVDTAAAGSWSGMVIARQTNLPDDHFSLRSLQADPAGSVFAVIKTSFNTNTAPAIQVAVGKPQSSGKLSWRRVTVTNGAQAQTRPILLLDTSNRRMYVFTADESGGAIYYKVAGLDAISFDPTTKGTPFIASGAHPFLNDPTSTRQNVNATSDIVVLASYDNSSHPSANPAATDVYAHNLLDIAGPPLDEHAYLPLIRR